VGRTLVIGAGKAGGAMAAAVDALWPADAPLSGLVVTRYDHVPPAYQARPGRIEVVEAAHPVPDEAGRRPAQRIVALTRGLTDTTWCCASSRRRLGAAVDARARAHAGRQAGRQQGAAQERRGHRRDELRAQAPLGHQGRAAGRAVRAGARGDAADQRRAGRRPEVIASGPTVPDASTCADALAILQRYGIAIPDAALRRAGERCFRDPQARRCGICRPPGAPDRHAAAKPGGRRRAGPPPGWTPTS
jgi:glycerate 2-kinase